MPADPPRRWVGLVGVLLATAAASGCAEGGPANPNLAAPKLVLQLRGDDSITIFIHSTFGERLYDWISLATDNATINNRTDVFSLEESIATSGFFLNATAGVNREMYTLRARLDVDPTAEQVLVSFHTDDGEWSEEPEAFDLPLERVLNRRNVE